MCEASKRHSPFNAGNEEDEVAVNFGAVDKFVNIAGVHGLSRLQAARPYAVAHWQGRSKHQHMPCDSGELPH